MVSLDRHLLLGNLLANPALTGTFLDGLAAAFALAYAVLVVLPAFLAIADAVVELLFALLTVALALTLSHEFLEKVSTPFSTTVSKTFVLE